MYIRRERDNDDVGTTRCQIPMCTRSRAQMRNRRAEKKKKILTRTKQSSISFGMWRCANVRNNKRGHNCANGNTFEYLCIFGTWCVGDCVADSHKQLVAFALFDHHHRILIVSNWKIIWHRVSAGWMFVCVCASSRKTADGSNYSFAFFVDWHLSFDFIAFRFCAAIFFET